MTEAARCPQCDAEIPEGAPAGLCPKCLLHAGLDSRPPVEPEFPPTQPSPSQRSGFVPPTPEELASQFPQLEILALVGRGGMGAVYKAKQRGLDRLVALKILPPEVSSDPAFAERFTREARALAKLTHSNIVTVYDFGQAFVVPPLGDLQRAPSDATKTPPEGGTTDGLFYFLMEYVDGVNLRQAIQAGDMTPHEALAIVPQICEALQFAHDEGIVHRDIKPENILIDKRGRVKIADFGLAKLLGQDASDHSLTATHQVMGTLRYMAPEQMQGSREVDHRADIYSLGVIFYELLTGELPMGKFAPPSKRVQVDVRLDEIVLRALEQEPEQRYQHASEVKTDVEIISRSPSTEILASKGSDSGSDPTARQVKGPAIGLWVAGLLYWISIPMGFVALSQPSVYTRPTIQMNVLFSLGLAPLVAGTMLVLAGSRMRRLEGHVFAVAACLLAIAIPGLKLVEFVMTRTLGMALGDLVAAPLGLWALVVLFRSDVRAAFARSGLGGVAGVAPSAEKSRKNTNPDPVSLPHLVQAPADCLLLAAGIAFVTACGVATWLMAVPAYSSSQSTNSLIRGNLIGMSAGLAIYSVFIGVAGLTLRRLRARLVVLLIDVIVGLFFPAVVALNVVMELRNIPQWPAVIPLWLGTPAALWVVVTLFRADVRYAFDAAAKQRAEKTKSDPVSLPLAALPTTRPKLVPVLATFNLVGAIVLMLVSAMEQPTAFAESVPRLWQVWETVDCVLGFVTSAGLFAASIGLFLWKPWARKLTLGVCVFSLATFVFDVPYLARFVLPDFYAEIQLLLAVEAVDPEVLDLWALGILIGVAVIPMLVALACLIGQLVYFNRPRVVAAFASPNEQPSKFVDWLFTGAGAVAGVLSVFAPLALLLGLAALFNAGDEGKLVDTSGRADSKTGEVWIGNKGAEIVMFLGPNSPTVSDRLASHLELDPTQRAAMDQALGKFVLDFRALEDQHTQAKTDENGHQITTIAPLQQQLPQLAERFWSELESALDGRQLTLGRKTVGLQMGMFETGDYVYRVEIWRVGQINPWYHWKESYPGRANVTASSEIEPSSGPELPEKLRRFWKELASPNSKGTGQQSQ